MPDRSRRLAHTDRESFAPAIVDDLCICVERLKIADQSPTPESIAHTLCSTRKTKSTRSGQLVVP
jgi:hypothetical protein